MGIITSESWVIKHKKELIIKHETVLIIKHKETKERSFFLDTKITSDLKVATKPTGWKQSIAGMEIFVDFVKAALAASVSSTADKTLSLCSFVF